MTQSEYQSHAHLEDPLSGLIPRVLNKLHSTWLRITYPFVFMGKKVSIDHTCSISRLLAHRISLGSYVCIKKDAHLGISLPPEEEGDPVLVIEDNCVVHWRTQIDAKNYIHLERDVLVTQDVLIIDHGHVYQDVNVPVSRDMFTDGGRIRIGQGSWIGHGAAIICSQGELTLGRNCVVNANAVVTRSAPPYSVLSGNPARIVKQFDSIKQVWVMGAVRAAESELTK